MRREERVYCLLLNKQKRSFGNCQLTMRLLNVVIWSRLNGFLKIFYTKNSIYSKLNFIGFLLLKF